MESLVVVPVRSLIQISDSRAELCEEISVLNERQQFSGRLCDHPFSEAISDNVRKRRGFWF